MDPSVITAWCMGVAAVIGAVAGVLKIVLTRPRLPVAEEVMERLTDLEEQLLGYAAWAHGARMAAAAAGIDLPPLPLDLAEHRTPHQLPPRLAGPDTNPIPASRKGGVRRGR